ncbi:hypothetical protein [Marinomonas colpomeniae]|uniref:hypothetical protein n=1 Tax=Marinomonas colpomeniae TaxID=2774408 RepID=UPI00174E8545|nr:hypothetical protein [Marinomonas colpomeniae]
MIKINEWLVEIGQDVKMIMQVHDGMTFEVTVKHLQIEDKIIKTRILFLKE